MRNVYVSKIDLSLDREGQYNKQEYINNLVIDAHNNHYLFQSNTYFVLNQELGRKLEVMVIMMTVAGISNDYNSIVRG